MEDKNDNKSLNQINPETDSNLSKLSDTSDKEIRGEKYFDDKNRYIYSFYQREIDGVYTSFPQIKLKTKKQVNLMESLDSLLKDSSNTQQNDILNNIIFKNFDGDIIKAPFILEVKKSIGELNKLLIQAKEISKVVKNTSSVKLPNYFIGIICGFENSQVIGIKSILQKQYRKNNKELFIKHMIDIINNNDLKVIFAIIKNENISGYPLGKDDFNIEGENLTKRIDINYFNKLVCNGEYTPEELDKICENSQYESLRFDIANKKYLFERFRRLEKENEKLKKENEKLKKENEKLKKENEIIKSKYDAILQERNNTSQNKISENQKTDDKESILKQIEELQLKLNEYEENTK